MINKIKQYLHEFFYLLKYFGFITAFRLKIKPLFIHYIINHANGDRLDLEHKEIQKYLIPILNPIIQKYKYKQDLSIPIQDNAIIWVCWWQGERNMPTIVGKCFSQLKKHSNAHPVVLITKDNYKEYTQFPSNIIQLFNKGTISIQQFSDIMRMYLISHHGGIWIDATYWVTRDINIPTGYPFFSIKTGNNKEPFVARGRWANNLLGGNQDSKFFNFMYEAFIEYWSKQKYIIDYFLIDYISNIAYDYFPDIKHNIDQFIISCPNMNIDMNQTKDEILLQNLLQENAFIKLNWKKKYQIYSQENILSLYGYFINL